MTSLDGPLSRQPALLFVFVTRKHNNCVPAEDQVRAIDDELVQRLSSRKKPTRNRLIVSCTPQSALLCLKTLVVPPLLLFLMLYPLYISFILCSLICNS